MNVKSVDDVLMVNGKEIEVKDGTGFIFMEFETENDGMRTASRNNASLAMMSAGVRALIRGISDRVDEKYPGPVGEMIKAQLLGDIFDKDEAIPEREPDNEGDHADPAENEMDLVNFLEFLQSLQDDGK